MQTNKSLAKDSKSKKRKILLGTLIPLGVLAVATAVVVPLVVTQCSSKLGPNEERFDIKDVSIVYYINNNNTGGTLYAFMYRGKESTYIVKMDFITLSDDLADGTIYTKDG
ncbi:hypothetical protein FACS189496_2540 [Bacilli bacterium]|nr:hypothetical protein FACS189496_2420 [Bacilli bacterium]GHU52422.1 hypothetical protein FACS189496_2540 [Bacilli bacterium]